MKNKLCRALSFAMMLAVVVGCDQIDQLKGMIGKVRTETESAQSRLAAEGEPQRSVSAGNSERNEFIAIATAKLYVLSNRLSATSEEIREWKDDRENFSKAVRETMSKERGLVGSGLDLALKSPVINEIAMKYLQADFAVASSELVDALAVARASEADYKASVKKLDVVYESQLVQNPHKYGDTNRDSNIGRLENECNELKRKLDRLRRNPTPTGDHYRIARENHRRSVSTLESRIRDLERQIDRKRDGYSSRRNEDLDARRIRENALRERNQAVEKLKKEFARVPSVSKTVESFRDKTLKKLELVMSKAGEALERKQSSDRENLHFLTGMLASSPTPTLSGDGLKRLLKRIDSL